MPNSVQPQSTQPAPPRHVESPEISFVGVMWFVAALGLAIAVLYLTVSAMLNHLQRKADAEQQAIRQRGVTTTVSAMRTNFPAPREQIAPALDLQANRQREADELNSYGWVDRNAGTVRIPIARAMELIVERGLPQWNDTNTQDGISVLQFQQKRAAQAAPSHRRRSQMKSASFILIPFILVLLSGISVFGQALSDEALKKIVFDQKPGAQISSEIQFHDESGKLVKLGDFFGKKPAILVMGYYRCPMLCSFVLNGMIGSLQDIKWEVGKEFQVIDVSIDPHETPELAAAKKKSYVQRYGRGDTSAGWHFLTGDETAIRQLANEVGFQFAFDPKINEYAHPSGLIVLTPAGTVSHYLSGLVYSTKELYDALADASVSKVGSPIKQFFLLCFHYSPVTSRYGALVMTIVRVCGVTVFLLLGFSIYKTIRRKSMSEISGSIQPP